MENFGQPAEESLFTKFFIAMGEMAEELEHLLGGTELEGDLGVFGPAATFVDAAELIIV